LPHGRHPRGVLIGDPECKNDGVSIREFGGDVYSNMMN